MKYIITFIGVSILLAASCSKENQKRCWQGFDPSGADITGLVVCDKTKAEAEAAHPGAWFYKQGETKYCWRADKSGDASYPKYLYGIPESMKDNLQTRYGYTLTKIDCSTFCHIKWLEKHKSKITGNFGPTYLFVETFVNTDSCSKLTPGRVITFRETTDSLITREVSEKKP
jgi:hypothetical protein